MSTPGSEARITNLEKEAMTLGARIEELATDTDGNFRALRQEIKQGYVDIGKALDSHAEGLMQEIRKQATKEDLATHKATQDARFDKVESDIAELKSLILQLLSPKE